MGLNIVMRVYNQTSTAVNASGFVPPDSNCSPEYYALYSLCSRVWPNGLPSTFDAIDVLEFARDWYLLGWLTLQEVNDILDCHGWPLLAVQSSIFGGVSCK